MNELDEAYTKLCREPDTGTMDVGNWLAQEATRLHQKSILNESECFDWMGMREFKLVVNDVGSVVADVHFIMEAPNAHCKPIFQQLTDEVSQLNYANTPEDAYSVYARMTATFDLGRMPAIRLEVIQGLLAELLDPTVVDGQQHCKDLKALLAYCYPGTSIEALLAVNSLSDFSTNGEALTLWLDAHESVLQLSPPSDIAPG